MFYAIAILKNKWLKLKKKEDSEIHFTSQI